MKLIVGLGNKGEKYTETRHNTGFILLDDYVNMLGLNWEYEQKFESEIVQSENLIYVKPQTLMNNSGRAVSKLVNYYKVLTENLLVVHDDVDLSFCDIKIQFGSSSAGHKGVTDIIEKIGTQKFWRIRVGIGRPENPHIDTEDWVLQKFSPGELEKIQSIKLDELLHNVRWSN